MDRDELRRGASAGKLTDLEARRLVLLHARRRQTVEQVRQLVGRAASVPDGSQDQVEIRRAVSRLMVCAAHVVVHVNEANDYARLASGRFCGKHHLCAFCARLRGARLVRDYGRVADAIFRRVDAHTFKLVLITCTVVNGPDLRERFDKLTRSWSDLHRRRLDNAAGKRGWSVLAGSLGGVASVEVKRGSGSGQWHPHLHALALVPVEQDAGEMQMRLREEWADVTGDGSFMCDVRDVNPDDDEGPAKFHGAFCEVFKYATKGGRMTPDDSCDAWMQLARAKFIRPWGWFYGVREPSDLGDVRDRVDFELIARVYQANEHAFELVAAAPVDPVELDRRERRRINRGIYLRDWLHRCGRLDASRGRGVSIEDALAWASVNEGMENLQKEEGVCAAAWKR